MQNTRRELKMVEGEFLFISDIAKLFKISPNTLRRRSWRQRNGIPLKKIGRQLCGAKGDIDRWFKGLNG